MSQHFDFIETPLDGLLRVNREPNADNRGFFSRFFCAKEFKSIGFGGAVAQINHTMTRQKGAIRGMHFQYPPHSEAKIVTCLKGEVLDVAVDIRKGSPTFLNWHMEVLSAENQSSLYIPSGFAHGFQTLTENCELIYLHSAFYAPDAEGALNALDPALAIDWPMKISEVSERDSNHSFIDTQFEGITI
ncbi:MAG: dTDP-4-dehydrorhamnose 3,5-epimerase [Cryomorphaceae bacterium]|jgi:dTDP-4-dehydrorhamnose 3,5-epimerase